MALIKYENSEKDCKNPTLHLFLAGMNKKDTHHKALILQRIVHVFIGTLEFEILWIQLYCLSTIPNFRACPFTNGA
jgi:hypothetical protein